MSDEFNRDGRSFTDSHDPMWTALDKSDDDQTSTGQMSLQYYNSSNIYTKDGYLHIVTTTEDTHFRAYHAYDKKYVTLSRHFKSGMLQGWNKFCFSGGILEFSAKLPGKGSVGGLWPAAWMLGNLGRATYEPTTNNMWPFSYKKCDREKQRAQLISG
jgi:beta-glucanase (GH16 family)